MGQLTYQIDPPVAVPGQIADLNPAFKVTGIAGMAIAAGTLVTLNPTTGLVQPVSGTSGSGLSMPYGIVCYMPLIECQAYPIGSTPTAGEYLPGWAIPIMRKGRIWVAYNGGTQGFVTTINVNAPSTGFTALSGVFTQNATSGTVGSEVFQLTTGFSQVYPSNNATVALVDINIP